MTITGEHDEYLAPVTVLPGTTPANIASDADDARVEGIILKRLARNRLSAWEVAHALHDEKIDSERIPAWLARYEQLGYLNDEALAEELVASCRGRKSLGKAAIVHELQRRNIPAAFMHAPLEEISCDEENTAANALAAKRLTQLNSFDDTVVRRRLTAFMLRRGYSFETVRGAVDAALSSRDS